jgi:hypothetical protein
VLVRAPLAASAATAAQPALVRAVVVSAADEDGYLEVVYEGAPLPGDDPFATVRVARDQVIAADTPPPAVPAAAQAGTKPRPLPVLRQEI